MPRKPTSQKPAASPPKGELFAAGEVESVVPELSAAQRATVSKPAPKKAKVGPETQAYRHPEAKTPLRPEVGTQDRFRHKKAPTEYRYDASLSPVLEFDGQNPGREVAEALLARIQKAKTLDEARAAATELTRLSRPFLNWTGKAERLSFSVPTLPLFIHERLSTKAILETLRGHRRSGEEQLSMVENLFGDPRHSEADQLLKAYAHSDAWVNRMILGDALVVMNSLLRYESLGGQVQMIYIDPPYGVKFGSNFQPFVRRRDVAHGDDEDLTREPEMVQAYRDTWELGLHSYLTYLRDRLLLSRELLHASGSIFVQISDENLHHVRELMDEVFGAENFVSVVSFKKTTSASSELLASVSDYLIWYSRDKTRLKFRPAYLLKGREPDGIYKYVRLPNGDERTVTAEEQANPDLLPPGSKLFSLDNLTSQRPPGDFPVDFSGRIFRPGRGYWKTGEEGMAALAKAGRLGISGATLRYKRFIDDFPVKEIPNLWVDTSTGSFTESKVYVVQTNTKVIERCMLMTTDPGDLVLDPTCGSGTTAYVAEQWGRRWLTIDVSRVPLALARQRLLTASFPWYQLKDEARGPQGGFVYKRKQNQKGEEVGGIVPHITLKSIANNEPPAEEVLVDRPEESRGIVRVCGPFTVEATIPTPVDYEGDGEEDSRAGSADDYAAFVARMIEVLRRSPLLRVAGGKTVALKNIRPPAKTLSLSAEAIVPDEVNKPVAFVFGPEHGAVSSKLVSNAAREAYQKSYFHLYVIGFAIEPEARKFIESCEVVSGIAATYVQATPDLMMGDLLKNMRSSHIFSVCGLPEIAVKKAKDGHVTVELLGLDVFDPVTMQSTATAGNDVPAWFLDTDYNGLVFKVRQAFFPRTSAWENLKKELKAEFADDVWSHLAGSTSAPFESGEHRCVAVKVIDDRGNELLVTKELK
jgi:adenine-specific DNA-methyltransferase